MIKSCLNGKKSEGCSAGVGREGKVEGQAMAVGGVQWYRRSRRWGMYISGDWNS